MTPATPFLPPGRLILSAMSCCCAALVQAAPEHAPPPRERLLLNAAWQFTPLDPAGTGDQLAYAKLKPWLLPTANHVVTPEHIQAMPPGNPGAQVAYTAPGYDSSGWRTLDLPHDWGIEGAFDLNLPGETAKLPWPGVAWYRKSIALPAADAGRRLYLEIDGAMSCSAVWFNGQLVGGWPYGYASYRVELTQLARPGADNVLAIRLDNRPDSAR